jgi:hypothetical protein
MESYEKTIIKPVKSTIKTFKALVLKYYLSFDNLKSASVCRALKKLSLKRQKNKLYNEKSLRPIQKQ